MRSYIISQKILVLPKFPGISLKKLLIFNFLLAFLLFCLYIFQVGFLTREIYLEKEYQGRIVELSKENEILEIDFAKLSSLSNIENYSQKESFVKVNPDRIKYIQIFEGTLTSK